MVLTVPYEEFLEAVKRIGAHEVFLAEQRGATLLTAADPQKNIIVAAVSEKSFAEVKSDLADSRHKVHVGKWSAETNDLSFNGSHDGIYVAAVSYRSREDMPGLWMDAFPTMPTPQIVLRSLYDEFCANDEIGNITYEEFLSFAHPNVVILSPSEISTYVLQKEEC